jgi:hypothetical protein
MRNPLSTWFKNRALRNKRRTLAKEIGNAKQSARELSGYIAACFRSTPESDVFRPYLESALISAQGVVSLITFRQLSKDAALAEGDAYESTLRIAHDLISVIKRTHNGAKNFQRIQKQTGSSIYERETLEEEYRQGKTLMLRALLPSNSGTQLSLSMTMANKKFAGA